LEFGLKEISYVDYRWTPVCLVHLMFDGLVSFSVVKLWVFHEETEFCVGFHKCL